MSVDRLIDLDGVSQRQASFRFDLLDLDNAPIGVVHPVVPCSLENDSSRTVKRSLNNLVLDADETVDVDPLNDRLRPNMVIAGVSYPLGTFLFADATTALRPWGEETSGTLVDEALILDQGIDRSRGFPAGYSMRQALYDLANSSTLNRAVQVDAASTVFGSPVSWPVGTSLLSIINDVAATAGLLSLYFDNNGVPRIVRPPEVDDEDPLVYSEGGRIYESTIAISDDLLDAPNRWVVVDTSATNTPIVGYYDLPDTEPNSYANRGFRITRTIEIQGVGSVPNAQAAARTAAMSHPASRVVSFDSAPDPRHDTYDIVEFLSTRYREEKWSLELIEGGTMHHELRLS